MNTTFFKKTMMPFCEFWFNALVKKNLEEKPIFFPNKTNKKDAIVTIDNPPISIRKIRTILPK